MKILFTGSYEPDYNRNKIVRAGLTKLGHEVIDFPFKKKSRAVKAQLKPLIAQCDFIYMPSFAHREVGFVKKNAGSKKLIFDPLVSRYLTKVHDYKLVWSYGISAWRNFYRDKWSMEAADFVVTDTMAHLKYYNETFKIPKNKMSPLYIGNNFDDYFPAARVAKPGIFKVGFYGGFIPLQGVKNILEAALLLKTEADVEFELIGSGFEFEKAKAFIRKHKLTHVHTPGWVNQAQLPDLINSFDVALGIFGDTTKADLVIPNKIYHYAACAKPIITKRSDALSEVFTDQKDILMIDTRPEVIAETIVRLKSDAELRKNLGQAAYKRIKEDFNEEKVATKLISYFHSL